MTCKDYDKKSGKCGVDGFKFYEGMNRPCDIPSITRTKCPRFAMSK